MWSGAGRGLGTMACAHQGSGGSWTKRWQKTTPDHYPSRVSSLPNVQSGPVYKESQSSGVHPRDAGMI